MADIPEISNVNELKNLLFEVGRILGVNNEEISRFLTLVGESVTSVQHIRDLYVQTGHELVNIEKALQKAIKVNDEFDKITQKSNKSQTDITKHLVTQIQLLAKKDTSLQLARDKTSEIVRDLRYEKSIREEILKHAVNILTVQSKSQEVQSNLASLGSSFDLEQMQMLKKSIGLQRQLTLSELAQREAKKLDSKNSTKGLQTDIENLKLKGEQLATLEDLITRGEKYLGILGQIKGSLIDQVNKVAEIAEGIPGLGTALHSVLGKVRTDVLNKLDDVGKSFMQTFLTTGNVAQSIKSSLGTAFSTINTGLVLAIGSLLIAKGVLDSIYRRVQSISIQTGLASDQAYELYKNGLLAASSASNQLSTYEDIVSVQMALTREFGRHTLLNASIAAQISDAAESYGYSREAAGQLQAVLQKIGANNQLAANIQVIVGRLAKASRIAPGIIAQDLVKNSKTVSLYFSGYPEKAAAAAVALRKMGSELGQVERVSSSLLDFQSSLVKQMEASVGLGRVVDLNAARMYLISGNIVEAMTEITKQVGTWAEWTSMIPAQKKLIAEASGLEVEELTNMLYITGKLNILSKEERELAQLAAKQLGDVVGMSKKALLIEGSRIQQSNRFNTAIKKIGTSLKLGLLPLVESLAIAFEAVVPVLNLISVPIKLIGSGIKLIQPFIEGLLWPLQQVGRLLNTVVSWIDRGVDSIQQFLGVSLSLDAGWEKIAKTLGIVTASLWGINKLIVKLAGVNLGSTLLGGLTGKIGDVGKALKDKIKIPKLESKFGPMDPTAPVTGKGSQNILSKAKESLKRVLPSKQTTEKAKESLKKVIPSKQIVEKAKELPSQTLNTPKQGTVAGEFLKNLGQGINSIGLKGAATILIVSASLLPLAYSLKMLGDVPWQNLIAGAGALTTLTIALKFLSTATTSLKGAAALALIGASLIPAAYAFEKFANVKWSDLAEAGVALVGLTATVALLGAALSSGVGAVIFGAGVAGFLALGLALLPLSFAINKLASAKVENLPVIGKALLGLSAAAAAVGLGAPGILVGAAALIPLIRNVNRIDPNAANVLEQIAYSLKLIGDSLKNLDFDRLRQFKHSLKDLSNKEFISLGLGSKDSGLNLKLGRSEDFNTDFLPKFPQTPVTPIQTPSREFFKDAGVFSPLKSTTIQDTKPSTGASTSFSEGGFKSSSVDNGRVERLLTNIADLLSQMANRPIDVHIGDGELNKINRRLRSYNG